MKVLATILFACAAALALLQSVYTLSPDVVPEADPLADPIADPLADPLPEPQAPGAMPVPNQPEGPLLKRVKRVHLPMPLSADLTNAQEDALIESEVPVAQDTLPVAADDNYEKLADELSENPVPNFP